MNSEERWNLFRVIWPAYIRLKGTYGADDEVRLLRLIIRNLSHV